MDVSTDLFNITMIKGSRQHIDIKRIMRACDLLAWFQQNRGQIDRLPIDQRVKINAGIVALPRLLDARNALLASHALDENGAISQRAQGDEGGVFQYWHRRDDTGAENAHAYCSSGAGNKCIQAGAAGGLCTAAAEFECRPAG